MHPSELILWSAMLGGMATLAAFALADAVVRRSIASWRAFVFVALTGAACAMLTGIAPVVFPDISAQTVHLLQNSLGLFSGALALSYLGLWMGVAAEDRVVRHAVRWGSWAQVAAGGAMALLTLLLPPEYWLRLLVATATINGLAVLITVVATLRAIALGDRLALGILAANALLACMASGLYAHALGMHLGMAVWIFTAVCAVGFFMLGTYLGLRRDRFNRQLERLASLAQGDDQATGLPKGSVLLSKMDDAFWRSARRNQECTVICLHVRNLYELAEAAGHNADKQILAAMSARLRRSVGFRNVVGLYHPRCFVVVISTDSQTRLVEKTLQRLHYLMGKPMNIQGSDGSYHPFVPVFGIGAVAVNADRADPAAVIDQAEHMALSASEQPDMRPTMAAPLGNP
ncbi:MAG: diguanylate cyclase [Pseudomonadota bacterium]